MFRTPDAPSVLKSTIDQSVNFVRKGSFPGFLESRFVRRAGADHFTCYLSSQTGCRQGCRMCHLTTTKQTDAEDALATEIVEQAKLVLAHYDQTLLDGAPRAPAIHYSFMARGEPLASEFFLETGDRVLQMLAEQAVQRRLLPRFLISTIMPKTLPAALAKHDGSLAAVFRLTQPLIYYSIYSTSHEFRKKWLPNALPVAQALAILKHYQNETGRIVKLHWSLIRGENDSPANAELIADYVDEAGLRVDVNLVRYNPPKAADDRGTEADEQAYQRTVDTLACRWPSARIKVVPRVGFDVFASCGMFVGGDRA